MQQPDLMDWKRRRTWQALVHRALTAVVGPDYPALLRAAPEPIDAADDPLAVFQAFEGRATHAEIIDSVSNEWSRAVAHVMAYHACRVDGASTYRDVGLQLPCLDTARARFRAKFTMAPFNTSEERLDAAIAAVPTCTREGRVFLALDPRRFIERCGQYLIYGSEYVLALTANIPGGSDTALRAHLRSTGRATVLKCRIPRDWIRHGRELVTAMIADHAYHAVHDNRSPRYLDHTVTLRHGVARALVVGYCEPTRIVDHHEKLRVWNDVTRQYE